MLLEMMGKSSFIILEQPAKPTRKQMEKRNKSKKEQDKTTPATNNKESATPPIS
jgi:hypothetical protein